MPIVESTTARSGRESESTKRRILAAAESVFADRGFAGASTREIAGRASVNISSLHYHWDSKEVLYRAVFDSVLQRLELHLRETIARVRGSGIDRDVVVAQVMESLYDFFESDPTIPTLLLRRLVEGAEHDLGIERDVFGPAWESYFRWLRDDGFAADDERMRLFMLSIHSILIVYHLDSPLYRSVLGESVRAPSTRAAVRAHVVDVVTTLLERVGS